MINLKQSVGELSTGKGKLTRKDSEMEMPSSSDTNKRAKRVTQTHEPRKNGAVVARVFSRADVKPFDEIEWDRRTALGVVLAAANYPDTPKKGAVITGLPKHTERTEDCMVFHAGTAVEGDKVVVNGGRVLCVTALGDSVKMAQRRAYQAAEGIHFDGMQYRRDIGHRAMVAKKP